MTENPIAKEIVDAAFRVHATLGPGLLESAYQTVLAYELGRRSLRPVSQEAIPVVFHVALIKDSITRIVNGLEEDNHANSPSHKEGKVRRIPLFAVTAR